MKLDYPQEQNCRHPDTQATAMYLTEDSDYLSSKNEALLLGEARALEQMALPQCDVG